MPNKTTTVVKEGILRAYEGIGGDKGFQVWAQANPSDFYTKILVRVLPLQAELSGPDGGPITLARLLETPHVGTAVERMSE